MNFTEIEQRRHQLGSIQPQNVQRLVGVLFADQRLNDTQQHFDDATIVRRSAVPIGVMVDDAHNEIGINDTNIFRLRQLKAFRTFCDDRARAGRLQHAVQQTNRFQAFIRSNDRSQQSNIVLTHEFGVKRRRRVSRF